MNQNDLVSLDELPSLLGRLRAARKASRLTQQDAAENLRMSRTTLVAIEQGKRRLRVQELMDLASLYGRSVNELLRPTPVSESFVARFRASTHKSLEEDHLESTITMLEQLADDYLELERITGGPIPQRYPPEVRVRGTSTSEAAESIASAERNRLGLGDGPVLELRKLLEVDVGIRIFAMGDLPPKIAGMFIYSPTYGACVGINANHPLERQRWSLAHEYAHFLAHRSHSEVTVLGGYQRSPAVERFADAFAENFLMPGMGIKRRFHEATQARDLGITPADLLALADLFQVSVSAMALRLENLGLNRGGSWDQLLYAGFKVGEARDILGITGPPPDADLLPVRFRYLATVAWLSGDITEGQVARLLRVDRTTARQLAAKLAPHTGLGNGDTRNLVATEIQQQHALGHP